MNKAERIAEVTRLSESGMEITEMAATLGVCYGTIIKDMDEANLPRKRYNKKHTVHRSVMKTFVEATGGIGPDEITELRERLQEGDLIPCTVQDYSDFVDQEVRRNLYIIKKFDEGHGVTVGAKGQKVSYKFVSFAEIARELRAEREVLNESSIV